MTNPMCHFPGCARNKSSMLHRPAIMCEVWNEFVSKSLRLGTVCDGSIHYFFVSLTVPRPSPSSGLVHHEYMSMPMPEGFTPDKEDQ